MTMTLTPATNHLTWTKADHAYVAIVGEGKYQIEGIRGHYAIWYYPNGARDGDFVGSDYHNLDTAKREAEQDHNLRTSHDAYRGRAMDALDQVLDLLCHARGESAMPHIDNAYYAMYSTAISAVEEAIAATQEIQHAREREETTKTL